MMDELDLLTQYMDELAGQADDLDGARERLVQTIAVSAPSKPARTGHRARRAALSLSGLVAVAAVAIVVALLAASTPLTPARSKGAGLAPISGTLPAGTQLRLLADRVAEENVPSLGVDQLLFTESRLSVSAEVNDNAAQATVVLDVKKWSNATGQSCTSVTAQPAQFATPAEQAAWSGLGLLDAPQAQPVTGCLGGDTGTTQPDTITGDGQLMDVSGLPTDPSQLAQELESGTTGIPAIDQLTFDQADAGIAFQRAAVLLLGPTVGSTPAFESALFQALALLPGVTSLGTTTTHDGQTGIGFAAASQAGQSAMVVDPTTGRLLELRNLDDTSALTSLAELYVTGPLKVSSYSTQLQWLDPVGVPTVVQSSDLPADVPLCIFGTAKPGVERAGADSVGPAREAIRRTEWRLRVLGRRRADAERPGHRRVDLLGPGAAVLGVSRRGPGLGPVRLGRGDLIGARWPLSCSVAHAVLVGELVQPGFQIVLDNELGRLKA